MKTAEVRTLFDYLKEHQAPLVKLVAGADRPVVDAGPALPARAQKAFELEVVRRFGFDDAPGASTRPCTRSRAAPGSQDIRITTRYFDDSLEGLFATMHEAGHGLYEHQVDLPARAHAARLGRLARACTSRRAGCGRTSSAARCRSGGTSSRGAQGALPGRVRRLRRRALVPRDQRRPAVADPGRGRRGDLQPAHHPALRARAGADRRHRSRSRACPRSGTGACGSYLGVEVPDDTRGVLQDTHWAIGAIGYFPTYALGNLISAQLWEKILADLPDLEDGFERGEFGPLREWLREHLHRHGRKFTPARDARARDRREGDRPRAVRPLPAAQDRRDLRAPPLGCR